MPEPVFTNDEIDAALEAVRQVAHAITPIGFLPYKTPNGARIGSLTEAGVAIADSLDRVAESINRLACAVEDRE